MTFSTTGVRAWITMPTTAGPKAQATLRRWLARKRRRPRIQPRSWPTLTPAEDIRPPSCSRLSAAGRAPLGRPTEGGHETVKAADLGGPVQGVLVRVVGLLLCHGDQRVDPAGGEPTYLFVLTPSRNGQGDDRPQDF